MAGFGTGDVLVKTEPETGCNHLYVSLSFNGCCYVYPWRYDDVVFSLNIL